jgi:hypothetical protein
MKKGSSEYFCLELYNRISFVTICPLQAVLTQPPDAPRDGPGWPNSLDWPVLNKSSVTINHHRQINDWIGLKQAKRRIYKWRKPKTQLIRAFSKLTSAVLTKSTQKETTLKYFSFCSSHSSRFSSLFYNIEKDKFSSIILFSFYNIIKYCWSYYPKDHTMTPTQETLFFFHKFCAAIYICLVFFSTHYNILIILFIYYYQTVLST